MNTENDFDDATLDDDDDMDDVILNGFEELANTELEDDTPEIEDETYIVADPVEKTEQHKPSHENMVPQPRFNQVKLKSLQKDDVIAELQRQLNEAQAATNVVDTPVKYKLSDEMKTLEKQYKEALFEDDDSALELREKIIALQAYEAEQLFERKWQEREFQRNQQAYEQQVKTDADNINETLAKWIADYPELDEESPEFDQELWEDTMTFQGGLVKNNSRMTGNDALLKALNKFVGNKGNKQDVVSDKPAKPEVDSRTQRSVTRGIEASKNAAPDINKASGSGNRSTKFDLDVEKMSEDEFAKIPKEVLDRMKGKK